MILDLPPLNPFRSGSDCLYIARAVAIWAGIVGCIAAVLIHLFGNAFFKKATVVCWITVPPIWFVIEYQIYICIHGSQTIEQFSFGQELAAKFWAGVAALLLFLWFEAASKGGRHGQS